MKKDDFNLGFWEDETCEYCNGVIHEKTVALSRKAKGKYLLIENVPAGVCSECGSRYYTANVLKTVAETVKGRRRVKREIMVSVYSL